MLRVASRLLKVGTPRIVTRHDSKVMASAPRALGACHSHASRISSSAATDTATCSRYRAASKEFRNTNANSFAVRYLASDNRIRTLRFLGSRPLRVSWRLRITITDLLVHSSSSELSLRRRRFRHDSRRPNSRNFPDPVKVASKLAKWSRATVA